MLHYITKAYTSGNICCLPYAVSQISFREPAKHWRSHLQSQHFLQAETVFLWILVTTTSASKEASYHWLHFSETWWLGLSVYGNGGEEITLVALSVSWS